jgi:homoserine kinase
MDQVTVRVPATSANLGPGFDCLGAALDLHGQVTVSRGAAGPVHDMARAAAKAFFEAAGTEPFAHSWSAQGDVPTSRGLGSSVVLRLGLLHGLNELSGRPLDPDRLYRLCAGLEGHPDNAAPAAFGGFAAARPDDVYFRCDIGPELHFVLLVPDQVVETDASRVLLPARIPRADAVLNTSHASLITAAFASRDYELLRGSLDDRLHQPYREASVPHLRPAIAAGVAAGALGGYLSGSGSAVACLTIENPDGVASALQSVLPSARVMVLAADNRGTTILGS